MSDIWLQPWFWPAVAVVVGLPVALLVLTELHSMLERRGSRATRIVSLLRNFVVPTGALLLLLSQAKYANIDLTWTQVTATVFGFLLILLLLNGLNFALFVTAKEGTWRSRIPSIFVDIVRIILIVVSVAVLLSVVWHADVGGFFTALGVGSIVIGLSLQNAVGSIVSGLLLLFEAPFQLGDWILWNGITGRIVQVNWRATHLKTPGGIEIIPNASLASASFLNISRKGSPYSTSLVVRFATDDAPQAVIDLCTDVGNNLPAALPGGASAYALQKGRYEVDIQITSPAEAFGTTALFLSRIWYAARRADLHLDRDLTDSYNTPENTIEAVKSVAAALYLSPEDVAIIAPQSRLERYGEGEVIQKTLVVPDGMRYILSGTATMATPIETGAEVKFSVLGRHDVLGLTALTRQGVSASITATSDVAVLLVPVAVLDDLVKSRPRLARDIGQEIDNRRGLAYKALAAAGVPVPSGSRLIA